MSRLTAASVVLIVFGGVLLLAAMLWAKFKNPRDYWDETRAKSMATAGSVHHAAAGAMAQTGDEARKKALLAAFEKSKADYEEQRLAFERARERFERPLRLMRWSGTICLVVGIVVYWVARGFEEG